jgi:transposase InsO family protein
VQSRITTDNGKAFSYAELSNIYFKYGIVLSHASNYYPQENGLAESSNKNLMMNIKKIVGGNKRSWHRKSNFALWANRITSKQATGKSPFQLVYGMKVILPIHLRSQYINFCNILLQMRRLY